METEETKIALLNPNRFREAVQSEWNRLPVIGLDYEVIQYGRTRSVEVPLSFYFSAYEAQRRNPQSSGVIQALDFKNFLQSLMFPTKSGLRPPTVEVTWPGIFNIIGVVAELSFDYIKFSLDLQPLIYTAEVKFLEVRTDRRYSERVRQVGLEASHSLASGGVPRGR
jgi:hypothetical protein